MIFIYTLDQKDEKMVSKALQYKKFRSKLALVKISENLENNPHCKIRKMVKIYFSRSVGQRNHHFIKNRFTILIFKNFMPIMVSTFIIFDILKLGSKIDFGKIDFENSSSKFFPA